MTVTKTDDGKFTLVLTNISTFGVHDGSVTFADLSREDMEVLKEELDRELQKTVSKTVWNPRSQKHETVYV